MVQAVEQVRERLLRSTQALAEAGVAYAVVGGNAVAAWVSGVDPGAVRNTRDVDLLLRRSDLPAAIRALEARGFVYRHAASLDMFLDGPNGRARDAVHVVFAAERVRADDCLETPDVSESEAAPEFQVIALEALTRMKLVAYRDKDRVHLRDLLDVGLLEPSLVARLPAVLASRLQALIDAPE